MTLGSDHGKLAAYRVSISLAGFLLCILNKKPRADCFFHLCTEVVFFVSPNFFFERCPHFLKVLIFLKLLRLSNFTGRKDQNKEVQVILLQVSYATLIT